MKKQLSTTFLLTATVMGGTLSIASFASAQSVGNTVNNTSVVNTLGTGRAVTTNRNSRSEIRNSGGANVHNDIQIGVHDGCGQSVNNNNVNHQGSVGAQVSVGVDLCNPAAGGGGGRQNIRR
jgi:predicted SpoU family rRNA methylase